MSDKYYISSVHERLINTKKYINCFTKRDKQELKALIKYVERLLEPKVQISRDQSIKMMERPNLFLQMLINKMYADIGDQDIPIFSMGAKRSKKKSLKSKSKRKMKKTKKRK